MVRNKLILQAITIGIIGVSVVLADEQRPHSAVYRAMPNIVVIVIDTLRADHVSCYGYDRNTTPNIDKLAQEGIRFERCYSTSSWTLPACVSLLTGLYTDKHDVKQWESVIPKHLPFLPEILSEHGYYCAGVSSNPFLSEKQGFSRGFDVFDDTTVIAAAEWSFPLTDSQYKSMVLASTGATTTRRAMELLNEHPKDKPLFLFVHYMDCHADYVPPSPFDKSFDPNYSGNISGHVQSKRFSTDISKRDLKHVVSLYDGEIAYTDKQVGQLLEHLEALDLDKNTCVILTADHGEEFLEHGNWFHGHSLFEECVRVPLIIRWPGKIPAGRTSKEVVSLVDVMPTVLSFLDVKLPTSCDGTNLVPAFSGQEELTDRAVVMETALGSPFRAIVLGSLKLISRIGSYTESKVDLDDIGEALFFDLVVNPNEDISKQISDTRIRERLVLSYANILASLSDYGRQIGACDVNDTITADEEHIKRLKSLGYIGN